MSGNNVGNNVGNIRLKAVINEVQRIASVAPKTGIHAVNEPFVLKYDVIKSNE